MSPFCTSPIAHYHPAKAHADNFLRETDLEWTIVCPGRLTDEPGNGLVSVADNLHTGGSTSRDNLADALAACLDTSSTIGRSFALLDGSTPLEAALHSLEAGKKGT